MNKTFIYIMRCHEYYKVGIAVNLKERLSALQIGNPYPINLIESFEIDSHYVATFEKRLHDALRKWRVRGEWFKLTIPELRTIKNVCQVASEFSISEREKNEQTQ